MINHAITLELPDALYQKFQARSRQTKRSLEEELLTAVALDLPSLPIPIPDNLNAYDEVMDFLASGPSPTEILQFQQKHVNVQIYFC